ncbi:MAG TPA: hypothetical protein VI306_07850 [Pyrinomonadaceae bacterium]
MQEDPTTNDTDNQSQHFSIDRDDWDQAFEPYEGKPYEALMLGYNFAIMRTHLDSQILKSRPVINALDLAMEALFPHTDFHNASFDLFIKLAQGKLTFDEEQMLNALGMKF